MFTFDFDSLVGYGFPNPDYFDFSGDTLIYGNYGGGKLFGRRDWRNHHTNIPPSR